MRMRLLQAAFVVRLAESGLYVYERAVVLNGIFGFLALLSFVVLLWQWIVARRFPLHRRRADASSNPEVTLLKPLKGCDEATESCLRSWFELKYKGPIQILFGVAAADDPVCEVVTRLISEFGETSQSSQRTAELVVCGPLEGANAKVSKLVQLEKLAKHSLLVISDADVKVAPDFLSNFIHPLARPATPPPSSGTGLVNCFYRLANP